MARIAVFSDSHDNIWNLERALAQVNAAGADVLLHCGDYVAPFIMPQLGEAFAGPIHGVWGNNDGDRALLTRQALNFPQITLHGDLAELTVDGVRVAVHHYPEIARPLAESGRYDLVCYGHNHLQNWERVGTCQLANPGEIMGRLGAASWGLFDTAAGEWRMQALEG